VLEYIRHLEELQFVSAIRVRENSRLFSFDSEFWGGGGIENFKNLGRGALKIYQ
jgi:hypothetical protein